MNILLSRFNKLNYEAVLKAVNTSSNKCDFVSHGIEFFGVKELCEAEKLY